MKKLLVFLLALLLTGCGASAPAEEPVRPDGLPAAPVELPEPVPEKWSFAVDLETTEGKINSMDGIRLLEHSYQLPVMTVQTESGGILMEGRTEEEERAVAVAQIFNDHFAEWRKPDALMELVETAQADLEFTQEAGGTWFNGYSYDLDCTVYRTERLVSVSGVYYTYTGGAHPNTYLLGWNFDLKNGCFVGAESLVGKEDLRAAVTEELVRQAKERAAEYDLAPEDFFWAEYETILADWPSYAVTFDAEGMNVRYSPYELAAYAAGPQEFYVDYGIMRPYLDADSLDLLGLN